MEDIKRMAIMKRKDKLKLLVVALVFAGVTCVANPTLTKGAETTQDKDQHKQKVEVEKSGGFIIKSQRQERAKNSTQEVTVNKSGGFVIIIQRNINKYKGEDLKNIIDASKKP